MLIVRLPTSLLFFFFNDTATTEIYPLSLHDALPICSIPACSQAHHFPVRPMPDCTSSTMNMMPCWWQMRCNSCRRSEEHTSELQSQSNLVCRLLLEKKKPIAPTSIPSPTLHHSDVC